MKNQFETNDLKVIIAYLYIDMAHRKENQSDRDKEISPVPPCRTSGGNQEGSRKKGSIIKLPDNYNFVELFPQLKKYCWHSRYPQFRLHPLEEA